MTRLSAATLFLLLSLSFQLRSADVIIKGSGTGYREAELRIFVETDPVTKTLRPVMRVSCDENGAFEVSVPVKESATINIKTGIYSFVLYCKEGRSYVINLPDFAAKSAEDENNPYFSELRVIPRVLSDSADFNNLVRTFDAEYDPAFNRIADRVAFNIKKADIPGIIEKLNLLSTPSMPEEMKKFIRFRMIMINMVSSGEYAGRIEDSVMINLRFEKDNPAYLDLVEQRFSGYFATIMNSKLRTGLSAALSESSLEKLRQVIAAEGHISNQELADYVIIMNLFPLYYEGSVPAANIMKLLESLISGGSSKFITETAATVKDRILVVAAGTAAPAISLKGKEGKEISLNDYRGSYILLSFASLESYSSQAELTILKSWYRKYQPDLKTVTVLQDKDFEAATSKAKTIGLDWVLLNGYHQDLLEYSYNIKVSPSFILISPDGKIINSNCPLPSENLERIIAVKLGKIQ